MHRNLILASTLAMLQSFAGALAAGPNDLVGEFSTKGNGRGDLRISRQGQEFYSSVRQSAGWTKPEKLRECPEPSVRKFFGAQDAQKVRAGLCAMNGPFALLLMTRGQSVGGRTLETDYFMFFMGMSGSIHRIHQADSTRVAPIVPPHPRDAPINRQVELAMSSRMGPQLLVGEFYVLSAAEARRRMHDSSKQEISPSFYNAQAKVAKTGHLNLQTLQQFSPGSGYERQIRSSLSESVLNRYRRQLVSEPNGYVRFPEGEYQLKSSKVIQQFNSNGLSHAVVDVEYAVAWHPEYLDILRATTTEYREPNRERRARFHMAKSAAGSWEILNYAHSGIDEPLDAKQVDLGVEQFKR